MTDPATPAAPGLEKRLRERADHLSSWYETVNTLTGTEGAEDKIDIEVMRQAADALAAKDAELDAADQLATALHSKVEQLHAELIGKDAALAKARVALEICNRADANPICPTCFVKRWQSAPHTPACPIGAALEAMGK